MSIKIKLSVVAFLQFAVWGAYLTSMGRYLDEIGLGEYIGPIYAMQGIASLFMPGIMGYVADRWVQAQRLLGVCHIIAAATMCGVAYVAWLAQAGMASAWLMFALYAVSIALYMPTLPLSYSVAYSSLERESLNPIDSYPPIRVWGTVGFICSMLVCDFAGFQHNAMQFVQSAVLGLVLGCYCFTLPESPTAEQGAQRGWADAMGIRALALLKQRHVALFFIFSMLVGVSLQITNGFANPYISSFADVAEYATTFGVNHANALISLSQISETLCMLLIPFALKHFGVRYVMFISMVAWVLRFGLFGFGNPGDGVWMFILSMVVYGVAFDFFNIAGSLYVNELAGESMRSSAQGLFVMATNGAGATIGMVVAQLVVNRFVYTQQGALAQIQGWQTSWLIFAAYAVIVVCAFLLLFRGSTNSAKGKQ